MNPKPHWKHNYELCEFLLNNGVCFDWVITTAFYSALHLVKESIFPYKIDSSNYDTFNNYYLEYFSKRLKPSKHQALINLVKKEFEEDAHSLYRSLYDMCMTSRYEDYIVSEAKARYAKSNLDQFKESVLDSDND